jgi:hypothetical protein
LSFQYKYRYVYSDLKEDGKKFPLENAYINVDLRFKKVNLDEDQRIFVFLAERPYMFIVAQ